MENNYIHVDAYADKICMMFYNTSNDNSHSISSIMHIHIHFIYYGAVQKRMVVVVVGV